MLTGAGQVCIIALSDRALTDRALTDRALTGIVKEVSDMISSDVIRGHLDAIILKLIIEKDRYGYEISKEISLRTDNEFGIKEATLYAVFQRLEKKELIESYRGEISLGSKRKYYTVTTLGKAYYSEKVKEWQAVKKVVDTFMEGLK